METTARPSTAREGVAHSPSWGSYSRTWEAARTGRGQEAASGTGLLNLGNSKDRERPGGGLRYRATEPRQQQGHGEGPGGGLRYRVQNLGSSKERERPGGGLRYKATEPRQQQGQGEARWRPQVQWYRT